MEEMNRIMLPLVGADSAFNEFHSCFADLAVDLNANIGTEVRGEFQEINPAMGELFDPVAHKSASREGDDQDYSDQPILVTAMIGIKFRLPGKEWRVCVRAEVELWRVSTSGPPGHRRITSIVPNKRPCPSPEQ